MNNISNNSIKICVALALFALAPIATAQPIKEPNPQIGVTIVAGADKQPLLTLHASETSASAILSLIAAQTGARIIVRQDAPIGALDVKRATLPDAITQVAQAAHLKLEIEKPPISTMMGGKLSQDAFKTTYTLRALKPDEFMQIQIDIKETSLIHLVETISELLDVKAQVDPQVPDQIVTIALFNTTATEALQTIADAAGLEVSKTASGYVLRERSIDLKFTDIPTAQLFKIISEQFGVQIRLAPGLPDKLIDVDFTNMTPIEALKATVKAANFEVSEVDGFYTVRERTVAAK